MITFDHYNINVTDLDRSLKFYAKAPGLHEVRRIAPEHGKFIIAYMCDEHNSFRLELTWLADHPQPYDLGEGEFHVAVRVDDYDAYNEMHRRQGAIVFENPDMGIYFIEDPDGYWTEIIPTRK